MMAIKLKTILRSTLAVIILLAFSAPRSNAQWRYGLSLGGEFASARLSDAAGYSLDNRSGFSGGLMLEYLSPRLNLGFDLKLLYQRYNSRLAAPGSEPLSFGRNFIDLPLHLRYEIPVKALSSLVCPLLYTGPDFRFRVGGDAATPLTTRRFQPGWDVGIGVDVVNFIEITAGYTFGLGNAVKDFPGFPDATLRTSGWNVGVNILFDF